MSKAVRLAVNQIIHDLEHRPEDYIASDHTIADKKTGFRYWIKSDFRFHGITDPYNMEFGLIQGWRFSRALKKWKAQNLILKSQEKNHDRN